MKKEERLSAKIKKFMRESGWDELGEEELMKVVNEQLEAMIKLGQVEQLIGEDGEFYYRSTGIFPLGVTNDEP